MDAAGLDAVAKRKGAAKDDRQPAGDAADDLLQGEGQSGGQQPQPHGQIRRPLHPQAEQHDQSQGHRAVIDDLAQRVGLDRLAGEAAEQHAPGDGLHQKCAGDDHHGENKFAVEGIGPDAGPKVADSFHTSRQYSLQGCCGLTSD